MRVAATIGMGVLTGAILIGVLGVMGCGGKKETKEFAYDVNLLTNGSFEEVGDDGLPVGWSLEVFRGTESEVEIRYEVDDTEKHDGERSWVFIGDPSTRRFLVLQQEIEVPDVDRVRLGGWMQLDGVDRREGQYAQCNFLLSFYDEKHERFQELRFADKRTHVQIGTRIWENISQEFRLPKGTRYVTVQCILGMTGRVWFDDISLSVPEPTSWNTASTKNFLFHWMPGYPYPDGAMQAQQALFDNFAQRLGLDSDVVIGYYFYPDTTTIRKKLSLKGYQYVSWDDMEFHSINANDNHEIIHFMTDPIGRPPKSVAEGTVLWLQNDWRGYPVHVAAAVHLRSGNLTPLKEVVNYRTFARTDVNFSLPSIASFVGYIAERWGAERLMDFYAATNGIDNAAAFAEAFEKTYEVPVESAEQQWKEFLLTVDISSVPRTSEQ